MPGLTPRSARACAAVCEMGCRVRSTSIEASCRVATRVWSPLPMTVAVWSVIRTFIPMMRLVSAAISCASAGVRIVRVGLVMGPPVRRDGEEYRSASGFWVMFGRIVR